MLSLPAWDVKQGHGSFLTFQFGEPKLRVEERQNRDESLRRSAHVHGQWHVWIYCCHWRIVQDGTQLAWSEDSQREIGHAAAALSGQKLLGISVTPDDGRSIFTFDLGGSLETWPYGNDPTEEQWRVYAGTLVFEYRADGAYACNPGNTPPDQVRWLPLR